ncbi:MAG: 50S ribosomal protein L4 [Candidatus Schekmanbacteria bacterium]|nr:MAG: 50S ribosomal protein L4 [Candidatus Schekmanbacteria bacterium]
MIKIVNNKNEEIGKVELPLSDKDSRNEKALKLIQQSVVSKLAGERSGTAYAKPRGAVAYSTKKLYRQKGTGRARAGSRRSPVRIGGGTIFGPLPRDYSFTIPKKMRKSALRNAFKIKIEEENLIVVDNFGLEEIKTREMNAILKRLGVNRSALLLLAERDEIVEKSARNISGVKVMNLKHPNAYDILRYEKVILLQKDVDLLKEVLNCS